MLLIRADAGAAMGTGHVMRCLALAQAWQDAGDQAVFVSSSLPPALDSRLRDEQIGVHPLSAAVGTAADARATADRARALGARWIVVDGYQFGADYQRALKDASFRLLVIDDYGHAGHYCAELVLNQNLDAPESLYRSRGPSTQLLLGCRYALLRREFRRWRSWRRAIPERPRKVLVTMGGGDQQNTTSKVIAALQSSAWPGLEARIIVGPANAHRAPSGPFEIISAPNDMAELMAWAELAISAAGSTCWELLFLGLPAAVVIQADNQRAIAERLHQRGVAVNLGWSAGVTPAAITAALAGLMPRSTRETMSRAGRELVDGRGAERVVQRLRTEQRQGRPA